MTWTNECRDGNRIKNFGKLQGGFRGKPSLRYGEKQTILGGYRWKKIIVNSLDTNEENYYNTPDVVTSLCLIDNIRIIVTLRHGFHILDLTTGKILPFLELQNDKENRFNDGKCDVMSRYWAGTMNLDIENPKPTASLYKLEDKKLTKVLEKLYRSNGLGWDPDNELFYLIDTHLGKFLNSTSIKIREISITKGLLSILRMNRTDQTG